MTVKQSMSLLYGIVAAFLLLCLLHMPYGFYILVRIVATLAFCFFAYVAKLYRRGWRMIIFFVLAIIFQPIIKFPLGREIWNILDVCVAAYLLFLILFASKDYSPQSSSTSVQKRNDSRFYMLVLGLLLASNSFAQSGEHIVILWDVTGSLLPQKSGQKDLDGSPIPTYSLGNAMWKPLKTAVIDCIEYAEEDPGNEITIVTFNDNIRDVFSQKASAEGKQLLVDFVRNYKYQGHKYTNIVEPITKFYNLLGRDRINYMFLFTDGDNDHPSTKELLIPTLNSWKDKTLGRNAFGFYVLVHPDADKPAIRQSVESQDNFWIVNDAKVRIKICSFPSSIKYNVRDEKGPKTIGIKGKYAGANGNVHLVTNDEYYSVICSDIEIKDGKLNIEVTPKNGVTPPSNHTVVLRPQLSGADPYTFVGPQEISLVVTNLPERNLNVTIEDSHLGKASYHGPFLFSKESSKPVSSDIRIDFSNQAKIENSSAIMKVYLVDKKSENPVSPVSQHLSICVNGDELKSDSVKLTPDMSNVILTVTGQPDTKNGSYYGRIELVPSNLDNYAINGTQDVFKWRVSFSQRWNPLKLALAWLVGLLLAAFLFWMLFLKPIFYPRFGSIQKTFNVPGMAPLIVKFKGARMVVVAASHQKKQSGWNRFWTGKILYKTHPAFVSPITFKPSRGRRVLARVQAGTYQVMPNPMPGVGAATIIDIKRNLKINVN